MGFMKKIFEFLTDDEMINDTLDDTLLSKKSHEVLFSPSDQFHDHDDMIFHFLTVFDQGDYEFITFANAHEQDQYIQVVYGDQVEFNIHYPFKDNPEDKLKACDVILPESFRLVDWDAGAYVRFSGNRIGKVQVVNLVIILFSELLGAKPDFILSGTID